METKSGCKGSGIFSRYSVVFLALTAYLIAYRGLWRIGFPDAYAAAAGCAAVYLIARMTKAELPDMRTGKKMTPRAFLALLGLLYLAQMLRIPVNGLFEKWLNAAGRSMYSAAPVEQSRVLFKGALASLTNLFWPIVLGPFAEELLYRGFAGGNFRAEGGRALAIVTAAAAFALSHGRLDYYAHTFVSGLVFGYLYFEYGVKWAVIFHVINNLGIMGLELLLCALLGEKAGNTACDIVGLAFALLGVVSVILQRREAADYVRAEKAPAGAYKRAFLNLGFLVFLAYSLYKCVTYIAPV